MVSLTIIYCVIRAVVLKPMLRNWSSRDEPPELSTTTSWSLDIICRPRAPVVEGANLSTWIRSLKEKPFAKRQDDARSGRSADVLVGAPAGVITVLLESILGN